MKTEETELLDVNDLAQEWKVPPSWIYRRTSRGHPDPLPFLRIGKHIRFRRVDISAWLENHQDGSDAA